MKNNFIQRTHDSISKILASSYTLTNTLAALPTTIELKRFNIAKLQSQAFGVNVTFNTAGAVTPNTQNGTFIIEVSDDTQPTPIVIQKLEVKPFIEDGSNVFMPLIGLDQDRTLTVKLQFTSTQTLSAAQYPQVRVSIEDR